ncbi:hypothetical protein GCM10023347_05310 [Streptomyces chumphonensis]|uniref:Uncharacterized protein n=1 Tax=Streptomyces chumphonensis TaxID=1214925 RepID=A0A927F035_9ACTN|nr:hypothetical protein [Streptomyces chumphonensis]MBD3933160.1 hypothetical protein [Streptomyces chumphonensis]
MNLAWIIAILRPLDIAPHANFRRPEYDALPFALLAGLVSGEPSRLPHYSLDDTEAFRENDPGIRYAELSLTHQGIREGLAGLIGEVEAATVGDQARASAFGLLACCAAAELDEYERCDSVLHHLLQRTDLGTPEGKLIRAALLQQKSLRYRDSGRKYTSLTTETMELLDQIEDADFSEFPVSPGSSVTYAESVKHLITSLRHAAWSLVPARFAVNGDQQVLPSVPTWQQIVRTQKSNQASRIDRLRASEYSKFVEGSFNRMFRSQTRTFGGHAPTLFYAALNMELLGDLAVLRLRKENALLKLVQCMSSDRPHADDVADALRLLRNANVKSEIDLAVERIRASGPLEALKKDAIQVLRHRTQPRMVRASELRILRGAAELLTQSEAQEALSLVFQVIEAGGAQPSPDSTQLDVVRLEPAWLTAAHLAKITEDDDRAAVVLLHAARSGGPSDELRDRAIGRSLRILNWQRVSGDTRSRWSEFLQSEGSVMSTSRSVFEALTISESASFGVDIEDLEDVANRVNVAMRGGSINNEEASSCVEIVRGSMAQIRDESSHGVFAFRALDPADIAAALIVHGNAQELWSDLVEFLTDRSVQRSDKSGAFDRLAHGSVELPPQVSEKFRRNCRVLLSAPGDPFEDDTIVPFPAALRFFASQRIVDEAETFSLISQLFGRVEARSREEASRTVAALAGSIMNPWLLAQAMQFSHDAEPGVRGHAARALATFSAISPEYGKTAEVRLVEMMREEGILVPLLVLRQVQQISNIPESTKQALGDLAANHLSVLVRREAAALLREAAQ